MTSLIMASSRLELPLDVVSSPDEALSSRFGWGRPVLVRLSLVARRQNDMAPSHSELAKSHASETVDATLPRLVR